MTVFAALFLLVAILGVVFWISQLIDLMQRPDEDFPGSNDKMIWALVIVFGSVLGALVYHLAHPIVAPRSSEQLRRDFAKMKNSGPPDSNIP
jgi:hypothetical protein